MNSTEKKEIIEDLTIRLQNLNLPGLNNHRLLNTFAKQILDSIRRVNWVYAHKDRYINESTCNPNNNYFDPIKAAIYYQKNGNYDEACWLIFLLTVCGKHRKKGWLMLRQIYQKKSNEVWSWSAVTASIDDFDQCYRSKYPNLTRAFGNHRKFETLKPDSKIGTNNVIKSYIKWIDNPYEHETFFNSLTINDTNSIEKFDSVYNSMGQVIRFGRMSIFDYLCMLGKVGLLKIKPGKIYIKNATGPKKGALKLFNSTDSEIILEEKIKDLNKNLPLGNIGFQILEDAICNWQKSPHKYIHFSG